MNLSVSTNNAKFEESIRFEENKIKQRPYIICLIIDICKRVFVLFASKRDPDMANIKEMQEISDGRWTNDNSLLITKSAKETNEWKLDFIKNATQSIEISGSICGGEVFREALNAIEARMKECPQLKVHILTTSDLLEPEDIQLIERLSKEYSSNFQCLVTNFHFDSSAYRVENHVKLMTIDEKYYIIGGTNYQDRLSKEPEKDAKPSTLLDKMLGCGSSDMDVVGCSQETAKIAREEFFKLFAVWEEKEKRVSESRYTENSGESCAIEKFDTHQEIVRNAQVRLTAGSGETETNACTAEFERLIHGCDKSIKIAHMYFHPQGEIAAALEKKIQERDIKTTVITAGTSPGTPVANHFYAYANRNFMHALSKESSSEDLRLYRYDQGHNIYHKKVVVLEHHDGDTEVIAGSYNWGGKSHRDYEMIITIRNDAIGRKVSKILDEDIEKSQQINRPPTLISRTIGSVEHILFPYLIG